VSQLANSSPLDDLIDAYCAAWSEPDADHRREILAAVWADSATYTDPTVELSGVDALIVHIGKVLARRPGAKVARTSAVDAHHGLARFAWRVVQADGSLLPEGIDLATVSDDGKIQSIAGFFGPLRPRDVRGN
jgi:SnoaL-like domain